MFDEQSKDIDVWLEIGELAGEFIYELYWKLLFHTFIEQQQDIFLKTSKI